MIEMPTKEDLERMYTKGALNIEAIRMLIYLRCVMPPSLGEFIKAHPELFPKGQYDTE